MADSLTALRVPGTVSFGGTDLGLLAQVQLRRTGAQTPIEAEEFGLEVVDSVFVGANYRLAVALRGWNANAINSLFPNLTGTAVVNHPGSVKPGKFRRADAAELVFTPRDAAHPTLTFNDAIPETVEEMTIDFAARSEHLVLCTFLAVRDTATPEGSVTWGL